MCKCDDCTDDACVTCGGCIHEGDVCLVVLETYHLGIVQVVIPGLEHYECAPPDKQEQFKQNRTRELNKMKASLN